MITEIKLHWGKLRWPLIAVASALLVAGVCKLDSSRQRSNETALALRWARQMATQAETLSLNASEHDEKDPLAWAARILSQGTDSRIIFAQKFRLQDGVSSQSSENYDFDADSGIFDYTKILFPEDSAGIRIKLYVARMGVFGAKTLFAQDLTIAAMFGIFFALLFFATKEQEIAEILPPPFPAEKSETQAVIHDEWVAGFKQALLELGKDIREMVRSAQKLSASAQLARQEISFAKEKLDGTVTTASDPEEMTRLAREAQALFATADPKTKVVLRRLLQISVQKASETESLKNKIEEISASTDAALEALKDVSQNSREMSEGITKTTADVLAANRSAK